MGLGTEKQSKTKNEKQFDTISSRTLEIAFW
jgi:hypothetical protein